jgi:hypothetical protein
VFLLPSAFTGQDWGLFRKSKRKTQMHTDEHRRRPSHRGSRIGLVDLELGSISLHHGAFADCDNHAKLGASMPLRCDMPA